MVLFTHQTNKAFNMSESGIKVTIKRILSATENSKIALFSINSNSKKKLTRGVKPVVDVVFDSTVNVQARIANKDPDYIGSYFGEEGALAATIKIKSLIKGQ